MSALDPKVEGSREGSAVAAEAWTSGLASVRESLTRVLAREGRNTLARVALVASELARFEAAPSVRERLETIQGAVDEIDSLLAKIDLLSGRGVQAPLVETPVGPVWDRVARRMAPVVHARGASLAAERSAGEAHVGVEASRLETILIAYLRFALRQVLPGAPGSCALQLAVEAFEGCLRLTLETGSPSRTMDEAEGSACPEEGGALGELALLVVESGGVVEERGPSGTTEGLPALLLPIGGRA